MTATIHSSAQPEDPTDGGNRRKVFRRVPDWAVNST